MLLNIGEPKQSVISPEDFHSVVIGLESTYSDSIHPLYREPYWRTPRFYKHRIGENWRYYADFATRDGDEVILPSIEFHTYIDMVRWCLSEFNNVAEVWHDSVLSWWRAKGIQI